MLLRWRSQFQAVWVWLCGFIFLLLAFASQAELPKTFDTDNDLILAQFDSKTDVDDLHAMAAFASLLASDRFTSVNYYVVIGAYGKQTGLYVPAASLAEMAFPAYSDAHKNSARAKQEVLQVIAGVLENGGDVWVAEAGQSDFTFAWLSELVRLKNTDTHTRIHVVQHSAWNENETTPEKLAFVKRHANYINIPDGNAVGNGSPGFNSAKTALWNQAFKSKTNRRIWRKAQLMANQYNGLDGRYNNPVIAQGGMDFSDLVEVCSILGCAHLKDAEAFFMLLDSAEWE